MSAISLRNSLFLTFSCMFLLSNLAIAGRNDVCSDFGPQSPRDIDSKTGENTITFAKAPPYKQMNLCNIHFHKNAEHKARAFNVIGREGESAGYKCGIGRWLSRDELKGGYLPGCRGVKPGDTIEVHWVFSSCPVQPGKGLEACSSAKCKNPNLRIESQVFTLVNDHTAMDFTLLTEGREKIRNFHQPGALPSKTGAPVVYLGSTSRPDYNSKQCSPLQVTWSVRPSCAKLDINSINLWCSQNVYEENQPKGVRQLVKDKRLLAEILK